jgi:rRNA maturation endonuclease Nob1
MPRPPILMKRFSVDAPDRRMRFIAKTAFESDITLRMLADILGLHETAVRRSFLEVNLRGSTIERYAQALKKDGQSVIPFFERRQLAQISPDGAHEITMQDLREISDREDARFIIAEHLVHLNELEEVEKERMLDTLGNLDDKVVRKMARLTREIQATDIEIAALAQQLKKKCDLLTDVVGITPAYAMVMAVITCGLDPYSAVAAVRSFLATLTGENTVLNIDAHLADFEKNDDLRLISTNRLLKQELKTLTLSCLEQNRTN